MLYSDDQVCVKISNKITTSFKANRGVKQGCIPSPLLFNIFFSDLQTEIESPENDPTVLFHDRLIGCLIWADDLL